MKATAANGGRHRQRQGFALVIVLSLMVLLVLLLLSMSQVLRTEASSAEAAAAESRAREMALFGLQKALGELQTFAGPDQRVTATADILGGSGGSAASDPTKKHWTGVWKAGGGTSGNREFLSWLVSAPERLISESDAVGALPPDTIELLGPGTVGERDASDRVRVPLVPVIAADGREIGEFAYWVGDEGVKARFDLSLPTRLDSSPERVTFDFMAVQRGAVELIGQVDTTFPFEVATDPRARRLKAREQLRILGLPTDSIRDHFHHVSLFSAGVLSDTVRSGLRKDLTWLCEAAPGGALASALASVDASPSVPGAQITAAWPVDASRNHWLPAPTFELFRSFYRLKDEPAPIQPRKQTDTEHGVVPVVTMCRVFFRPGVRTQNGQSFLRLNLDVQVILWNPHNVPIAGQQYDLEIALNSFDMALQIGASDHGRVHDMVGAAGAGFQAIQHDFGAPASGRCLVFRIPAIDIPAGTSLIFTVGDDANGEPYSGANALSNQPPVLGLPNTVWLEHPVPVAASAPIPAFRLRRQPNPNSSVPMSGRILAISLRDPATGGTAATNTTWSRTGNRSNEGSSPAYIDPTPQTLENALVSPNVNHIQQIDAAIFSATGYRNERWIANYNPRALVVDQSPAELLNNPSFGFQWRRAGNRAEIPAGNYDGGRVRFLPVSREQFEVALFELPTGGIPRLSIADFQHAHVHPTGSSNAYLIGNSLADMRMADSNQTVRLPGGAFTAATHAPAVDGSMLLNEALWDRFFLSTARPDLSDADIASGRLFPNARMRPHLGATAAGVLDFHTAAANLFLDGAFNVNSTSVDAWAALLGGKRGLLFNPVTGTASTPLSAGYSRMARPLGGDNEPWLGFRSLSDGEIRRLSERIVEEVRRRGPFVSLADFVNRRRGDISDPSVVKGAIARAIDAADLNANSSQNLPDVVNTGSNWSPAGQPESWYLEEAMVGSRHEGATNWITQGDILQAIGGAISARSDTFIIRSFGQTRSRSGEIEAEAWCEAVVQRLPTPVEPEPSSANEPRDPERHGRRFEVISFRWLDRDAI